MSNNANLYNAALAGASAGIASRWLTNTSSISYDEQTALIADFAAIFDDEIAPIVGGGSQGEAHCVESICSAFWTGRNITPTTDLESAAIPLAALFTSLQPNIEPDPGSGVGAPLPNTLWVASDGVLAGPGLPLIQGTSSAFTTLTAGAAALAAGNGRLLVVEGDYSSEADIDFGVRGASIIGIGGGGVPIQDLTDIVNPPIIPGVTADKLVLEGVQTAGLVGAITSLAMRNCLIVGGVATVNANVYIEGSHIFSGAGPAGIIAAINRQVQLKNITQFTAFASPLVIMASEIVVDESTLSLMGYAGVRAAGSNFRYGIDRAAGAKVAQVDDLDMTFNSPNWGTSRAQIPGLTLTANRANTVDMTDAPADGLFIVDRYDTNTAFNCTFNGVNVPAASVNQQTAGSFATRVIFQNVGGVLTKIQQQCL